MEDIDMDKKLTDWGNKISQLSGCSDGGPMSAFTSGMPGAILKRLSSPYVYFAAIPILVGILLYYAKPGCMVEMESVEGEYPKPVIRMKRFALLTMILSVAVGVGIYIYFFRKKTSE
jgi:hypothetical protein